MGSGTVTEKSRECTKECIDIDDIFCREFFTFDKGICCAPNDAQCLSGEYDFCTDQFESAGMKLFSCPFEESRCGPSPMVQLPVSNDGVVSV